MAQSMSTEDKIAHFLRLAEDESATQAERDTATVQAERLMLKHGIDRATAEAADTNRDERITKDSIFFGGAYAQSRTTAANQVVTAMGLRAYMTAARDFDGNNSHATREVAGFRFTVIGYEGDLRDAMTLIRSLDVQSAVAMKAWAKGMKDAWYWHSAAEKTRAKQAFSLAFGIGAGKRIKEARAVAVQEAEPGTALVLADRTAQVSKWMYENNSNLRKSRSRGARLDGSGFAAGQSAGYNANTGAAQRGISSRLSIGR